MRIFTYLQMLMKILYAHFGLTTILRKSSLARGEQDIYNRTDSRRYKLLPFLVPTLRKTNIINSVGTKNTYSVYRRLYKSDIFKFPERHLKDLPYIYTHFIHFGRDVREI